MEGLKLAAPWTVCSTLYDVFGEIPCVFFCTDTGNASLGMPLGECP